MLFRYLLAHAMQLLLIAAVASGLPTTASTDRQSDPQIINGFWPPPSVPAAKKELLKAGILYGDLVRAIGPGWMSQSESVGIVRGLFDDGTVLAMPVREPNQPVRFGRGSGTTWDPPQKDENLVQSPPR